MHVHVVKSGRLVGNETFMRGEGWASLLRPRRSYEFPAQFFVLERPEGLLALDTGINSRVRIARPLRRFVPVPLAGAEDEAGPRLRRLGVAATDVRTVLLTHLDWDHAGGLDHFPGADVLVHRPELEFASTRAGRLRYMPDLWPAAFRPTVFDLVPDSVGPFPASAPVPGFEGVRVVPLAGHSAGQVGVMVDDGGREVLFCADHTLRLDWFERDFTAGREIALGVFFAERARETSRRLGALLEQGSTLIVPSHDSEAAARLARQPVPASPGP